MGNTLRNALYAAAVTLAAVTLQPADAQAGNDYCREYTRTVYIGGRTQDAYGTACLQPDGSWMIVGEGLGNDIPYDAGQVNYVIHDNRRDVVPQRVVYYDRRPVVYQPRPAPLFVWYNTGRYERKYDRRDYGWRDRRDHHDRWDRHPGRGHGRGHGRD